MRFSDGRNLQILSRNPIREKAWRSDDGVFRSSVGSDQVRKMFVRLLSLFQGPAQPVLECRSYGEVRTGKRE